MERIPIPRGLEVEQEALINQIVDAAAMIPVVLDTAPTTVNQILKEGQRGVYGGFIYETINGTTYKYGVAV